ncbi:hypothetical protein [Novosphingobium mangrovi (ex Huang et al. 2023)]|uniref:Cupin 2 conserved barrel domain-containing protein n=1 Tax=Novosphingobium mangrovi (ex Huang et al. 2023) TaxID=2976432 RepID=A0ABT2I6H7_9SPHN|nr:hypothetical protein [Novosphingobium mangrovi (ex Huang et al. 2023)]MCT2400403.1 hypothetical protein [Novosphingobium mangrovi (ex Huang et al. 2023)]
MAKVLVVEPDKAPEVAMPGGLRGQGKVFAAVTADRFPLELHRIEMAPGERCEAGPHGSDTVLYVLAGGIGAGGCSLPAGSSMIVERGARAIFQAGFEGATVLVFAGTRAGRGEGGHVHLLPRARVPACERMSEQSDTGGAIHADSDCPSCEVWLHENHFSGTAPPTPEEAARGVHSHSEDEIIVVLDGAMRLGGKLVGPGTALAIAADTLYSFTPGPEGLSFVNFRAHRPGDIRFVQGPAMSETSLWREILPRPEYLEPLA